MTDRRLLNDGRQVELGGVAFDVLVALVDRAGEIVSKRKLMELVWPSVAADENGLRVQIAYLRKALGDEDSGSNYIKTVYGRGYCFVAPISLPSTPSSSTRETPQSRWSYQLPARLSRMVGREEIVRRLSARVLSERFVTIVGPGGVGKTTVAVAVGHALLPDFEAAAFFDLGPLSDPLLVASTVASTLGLRVPSDDPIPGLVAHLRDRSLLLILDSCEHVIDAAAALAECVRREAPRTCVLTTSREPLRAEGEKLWQLVPLESPPDEPGLTADMVLNFSAARLFVDRATAGGFPFELHDSDAPAVGEICRRLDGIALAIELVAGQVNAFGIQKTAELLSAQFEFTWKGRRVAPARHQTLRATLDWSYNLLSPPEQAALRKLAIFVGAFTLEAACSVAHDDIEQFVAALHGLVSKSLLMADISEATARYRLLDTTRSYALSKLLDSGDSHQAGRRHATYHLELLERAKAGPSSEGKIFSTFRPNLGNVRAALEWSLLKRADVTLGLALAAASAPLFLELALVAECNRWTGLALAIRDDSARATRLEMELQIHHGISSMLSEGSNEAAGRSLKRGLELAGQLHDKLNELRTLGRLSIFHHRAGDLRAALAYASDFLVAAEKIGDPVSIAEAHGSLGALLHVKGDYGSARLHINAALAEAPDHLTSSRINLGYDQRSRARITLAAVLWVQGFHHQAMEVLRRSVKEAERSEHSVTCCMVLVAALHILLRAGDLDDAEQYLDQLTQLANKHMLAPYQAVAIGMKGALLTRRRHPEQGVTQLRSAIETLNRLRYNWLTGTFIANIARGLAAMGRFGAAIDAIDEAIAAIERDGALYVMPEMLRIKGWILMSATKPALADAEGYFLRSLDLATRQAATAWRLRTATSLAMLRLMQHRGGEIEAMLAPICDRFKNEDNRDVATARRLLAIPHRRN